jgi:hypothetical protein
VLYLNHEEAPSIIAGSFSSFMKAWESLFYVGPEIWMLEPFLNSSGHLDGTTPAAVEFRQAMESFLYSEK